MGSACLGFYLSGKPAWLLVFYLYGLPNMQSKVHQSVRCSSFSFKNGVSPVRATCSFASSGLVFVFRSLIHFELAFV